MSKAKTYTVARKEMTSAQIVEATGVSAGKLRVQLTIKGIKDIKKAVIMSATEDQMKAVKKLFGESKAKKRARSKSKDVSKQAKYNLDGSEVLIVKFSNKTISVTLKGKKVPAKAVLRAVADKEGMSYKKEQHQRTLANNLLKHLEA